MRKSKSKNSARNDRARERHLIPVKQAVYIVLAFGLLVASAMLFFVDRDLSQPFFERPINIYRVAVMSLAVIFLLLATKATWWRKAVCNDLTAVAEPANNTKWLRRLTVVLPLLAIGLSVLQLINPELGALLVRKESWPFFRNAIFIKAFCQLVGVVVFVLIANYYRHHKQWLGMACAIAVAILLFVMAGEELSWGQRIFGWSTPDKFSQIGNNSQNEMNFHNFATQEFQNTLYFGGWLLLIGFAFWNNALRKLTRQTKAFKFLGNWLPPIAFVPIFAAGFAFGDPLHSETGIYYGSNLFIVLATAILLVALIIRNVRQGDARGWGRSLAILAIYLIILVNSLFFSKVWDSNAGAATEYMELYISFGFMLWALTTRQRLLAATD